MLPPRMYTKDGVSTNVNDAGLMTSSQVAQLLNVSVRTLWRMCKAGQFPQPLRWNKKLVRWKGTVVNEWLKSQ